MEFAVTLVVLLVSMAVLIYSADTFVEHAERVAEHFKLPHFLIGALILGFGTSAPEIAVSALASLEGSPGLALGNALGSNTANFAMVLGATLLLAPLLVQKQVAVVELPLVLAGTVVLGAFMLDGSLGQTEGVILLVLLCIYIGYSLKSAGNHEAPEGSAELSFSALSYVFCLLGLVFMLGSSHFLVQSAVELATRLGVSELVIGLTVIAIGTSLPELVSSLAAAKRGNHSMILGNLVGSNLFNLLAVVGVAAVIHSIEFDRGALIRDYGVLLALTCLVAWLSLRAYNNQTSLTKHAGALLLTSYIVYMAALIGLNS